MQDLHRSFTGRPEFDLWYAVAPEHLDYTNLTTCVDLQNHFIQEGDNLGDRMCHAFNHLHAQSYEKTVLIGSDIPDLAAGLIGEAFSDLDSNDAVIGPTVDGGYYLIGMHRCLPSIFTDITWSTDQVLRQTLDRADTTGIRLKQLHRLEDIDTFEDLKAFHHRLSQQDVGSDHFPLHTWNVIKDLPVT